MNTLSIALQAGGILFREGLEALLIIAALAAFLKRVGTGVQLRALNLGALAAIVASFGAAFVFLSYFNGAHDDRLEAVIMILAALLMLYMSGWLFLKQDPRAWKAELQRSAQKALMTGTLIPLAAISFLAVFREGAESILFLHALASTSGGWSAALLTGLVAASLLLVVTYIAIQWLAVRLPLRPIFLVTSAFLFVMGLKFVGGAIAELQEQALVSYSDAPLAWLETLGFNPTWEALGVQALLALIAIAGTLGLQLARPAPLTAAE